MRRADGNEREGEARERQDEKDHDDDEDTQTLQIRRGLPPVVTLAGGLTDMIRFRLLLVASLLGAMALAACGGAGGGGAQTSSSPGPALGTNNPAPSATPSDPYSEPGY
jgi:hypothetical protein